MKILMLVNWKIEYTDKVPADKQPPDYYIKGEDYWFFRYFKNKKYIQVDVVDVRSFPALEKFEKNKIRFYVWQIIKILPRLRKYDLVLSHGMQSGIVLCLGRRLFGKGKYKHIVFDIGAFNSAKEEGRALKLMQFASKTLDGVIYHTAMQEEYYKKCHPWLLDKSQYIAFGTDSEFFRDFTQNVERSVDVSDIFEISADMSENKKIGKEVAMPYILSIGYNKRDWDTLIRAYEKLDTEVELHLLGNESWKSDNPKIRILPPVSVKEMMEMIEGCLFGVLPLKWFNYSYGQMTLMQQMALGKAVIVSEVPSVKDYAKHNVDACFYPPENIDALAEQMKILLEDRDFRKQIGQEAAKTIKEKINEKVMAGEIEKFIWNICERKDLSNGDKNIDNCSGL